LESWKPLIFRQNKRERWPSIEREMIERALRLEHGDQAAAGKRLGITKTALQKRLK
jgi:transcriptional regulator with PAS, ATPase and Fis domain